MIKCLMFFVLSFVSFVSFGNPVIVYPNGSQYTLKDGEVIYIHHGSQDVYAKSDYNNGNIYFTSKDALNSTDPEADPLEDIIPGSEEWCEKYVPFTEGYTWDDQMWQRACQEGDG